MSVIYTGVLILMLVLILYFRKYDPLFDFVYREDEVVLLLWYNTKDSDGNFVRDYKEVFKFKRG